jgi:pheromone shutdown protein TraB
MRWQRIGRVGAAGAAIAAAAAAVPLPEITELPSRRRVGLLLCGGRYRVTLLGVSHTSAESEREVRDVVSEAIGRGTLAAVALESDDDTLVLQRAASAAVAGLSDDAIRARGVTTVQHALFAHAIVRQRLGPQLERPDQIVLSKELRRGLAAGRVHGREMATAAELADEAGFRVACIDMLPADKADRYAASARADAPTPLHALISFAGQTYELRARALARGGTPCLDDYLAVMRRYSPATHAAQVADRDEHMALEIFSLCDQLRAEAPRRGQEEVRAEGEDPPFDVVVVCGAAHLPGLEARLQPVAPTAASAPSANALSAARWPPTRASASPAVDG